MQTRTKACTGHGGPQQQQQAVDHVYLIGMTTVELSPHRVLVLWATIEGPGAGRFETGLGGREYGVVEEGVSFAAGVTLLM